MKIGLAQIVSQKGNIAGNLAAHKKWIEKAILENTDAIFFPELSLTAYDSLCAKDWAMHKNDVRLEEFQKISDQHNIVIGVGLPIISEMGIQISMAVFQPRIERKFHVKQLLHVDEIPYFTPGNEQLILAMGNKRIAPAICFEAMQKEHLKNAKALGANIYLASVAKHHKGVQNAMEYYPKAAAEVSMPILMVNTIGNCDNFKGAGQSTVWDSKGNLKGKLGPDKVGMLIYDIEINEIIKKEEQTAHAT